MSRPSEPTMTSSPGVPTTGAVLPPGLDTAGSTMVAILPSQVSSAAETRAADTGARASKRSRALDPTAETCVMAMTPSCDQ